MSTEFPAHVLQAAADAVEARVERSRGFALLLAEEVLEAAMRAQSLPQQNVVDMRDK
jgi:hypothetical protein